MRPSLLAVRAIVGACRASAPTHVDPPLRAPEPIAPEPIALAPARAPAPTPAPSIDAPELPAELATLPTDVRVADAATLAKSHSRDCKAFAPRTPCEHRLDIDDDDKPELGFKVRARSGGHAGVAIARGGGGISIIAAGARMRQLANDVYQDGVDLAWREVETDLDLDLWKVAEMDAAGFVVHAPKSTSVLPAPGRAGAGLWLDDGDAAEILYWDGARWRRLVVGF